MEANAVMALAPKGEEVSLKTLKKKEIDKIMRAVTDGKQAANDYYKSSIEPKILEREEIYNATKGTTERSLHGFLKCLTGCQET